MKLLFRPLVFFPVLFAVTVLFSGCSSTPTFSLLSNGQKKYVNMPRKERIACFADKECRAALVKNKYYPQTFQVDSQNIRSISFTELTDKNAKRKESVIGKIKISAPAYVLVEKSKGKICFGNLKIAKSYQWQCDNGTSGTFQTEDLAPRLLKIKGVPNVRDLGGRVTMDGKRVKQGMVYRTAGLNDNAAYRRRMKTPEEMNANNGYFAKLKVQMEHRIAKDKVLLKQNIQNIKLVPYSLQNTWTVYLPDHKLTTADYSVMASLKNLPSSLFGGKAFTMKSDAKGKMMFPKPHVNQPSVFCQVFDSPADGIMQIGTGADWYYAVYVNGDIYLDLLTAGNGNGNRTADDHVINVQVRKGKNIIVIPLLSGASTWSLAVNKPTKEVRYKAMLQEEIKNAKNILKEAITAIDAACYTKGRNRLNKGTRLYLVRDLGIRSDIDLRSDSECWGMKGSPAGKEVTWFHYSSSAYGGMQHNSGKQAFQKVFKVFLNEKNYPIVFHCIAGQDRTGAVAFIINALLGVPEEQLFLDWEVTGFWNSNVGFNHANKFNHLYAGFNKFPGKTIHERVENYVLSLGFTKTDIAKLRDIMLENKGNL